MGDALSAIERALEKFPQLTDYGFGVYEVGHLSEAERDDQFRRDRADMFHPRSINSFVRARRWLEKQPRTKNVNDLAGSSYGLKHVAEPEIGYVSNGVFIAAAIAAGFTVERCSNGRFRSPNAFFNISARVRVPA